MPSEEVRKLVRHEMITTLESALTDFNDSAKIPKAPQGIICADLTAGLARQVVFVIWRRTLESPIKEKTRTCDILAKEISKANDSKLDPEHVGGKNKRRPIDVKASTRQQREP